MSKERTIEHKIEGECLIRDYLRRRYSGRRIHFLREKGCLLLNGTPVTVADRAMKGDLLTLIFKETESFDYQPIDLGVRTIYTDEDILVVYKPAGVASMPVAPHFSANLLNGVKFLYSEGVFRVVTRLDKNTSGLVLLTKNALSHSILHEEVRSIKKTYTALVEGNLSAPITIDAPICSDGGAKRFVAEGGKPAKTRIIASNPIGDNSLLTIQIDTGRTHQIRVHTAHVGHPIVGDGLYGAKDNLGQMLACTGLEFVHPITRAKMEFFIDKTEEIRRRFAIFTINSQKTL